MAVSNYRGDIDLPVEVSREIWAKALANSAFLSLARHIDLPGTGQAVPVITGDAEAQWIGETDKAPISNSTFTVKYITPYKMSVIEPVSKEFVRDYDALYAVMVERLPKSLAKLFDTTIAGWGAAPGTGFDTLKSIEEFDLSSDAYQGFVAANGAISAAGYRADKIALDPNGETLLYASVDDVKRPLFIPSVHDNGIGSVLGKPVSIYQNVGVAGNAADVEHEIAAHDNTVGFIGDWSKAVCGIVQNITLDIAREATLTKANGDNINLWQQGMVAVKATFEAGFAIEDTDAFARLTTEYDPS
jgi:HK97 family phage major capsid protein